MDNVQKSDVIDALQLFKSNVTDNAYLSIAASDTYATKTELNVLTDTYATKTALSAGLNSKASTDTATSSAAGITKLYGTTGVNTDGTITQAAITTALAAKLDSDATAAAAFKDSSGNVITDTYVTKSELNALTDTYATKTALSTGLNSKLDSDAKAVSATTADKLKNAQNFIADLNSTVAGSFNGTVSVAAGVTGTLPVANGGTGQSNLDNVTVGAATKAFKDSAGNVITDTYVTKSELSHKLGAVRYGYRIKKDEADPDLRVEYLYDAAGMRPAHMVFDTDTETAGTDSDTSYFDYGDWQSVWFVRDNKPCMLKYDGTVDYYLDPNDYSKRETPLEFVDGTDTVIVTDTDVANTSYNGNAMAQFPLVWIYRYEDDDYLYEIVSNVQWDENYKAFAHTDKDGNIKPYFYHSLFEASGSLSKLRSLSGQPLYYGNAYNTYLNSAQANGSNWYIVSWSQRECIRTLLVLLSKSFNIPAYFGHGNIHLETSQNDSKNRMISTTGTLINKGQFVGYNFDTKQVKVFHIEGFWGNQNVVTAGFINSYGKIYLKMTPPYSLTSTSGYTLMKTFNSDFVGDVRSMSCSQYGMFPTEIGGSLTTYYFSFVAWISNLFGLLYSGGAVRNPFAFPALFQSNWGSSQKEFFCGTALAYV